MFCYKQNTKIRLFHLVFFQIIFIGISKKMDMSINYESQSKF